VHYPVASGPDYRHQRPADAALAPALREVGLPRTVIDGAACIVGGDPVAPCRGCRLTLEGSGHMVLCNDKVDRKFRVDKS